MSSLQFSHGLAESIKLVDVSHQQAEEYIKNNNDLYEITFSKEKMGRAFIDIDGKMSNETSEDDFETTHQMILTSLSSLDVETPFSICSSSKYGNKDWKNGTRTNKLSYSLLFIDKCGSKDAVAIWTRDYVAPLIKEALSMTIPFYIKGVDKDIPNSDYLDYDNSVYRENGKMRCVLSTKPNEKRPKIIHSDHSILDTMITYIPDGCEPLPEPVRNEIIIPSTPVVPASNDTLYTVVMALNADRADNYKDWLTIGMALHHEGASVETWAEFSKQSSKYRPFECERMWRGFRQGNLTQRSLWKMLKEDNPVVFKSLCSKRTDLDRAFGDCVAHFPYAQHFVNCRLDDYLYDGASGWWFIQSNKTWANSGTKFPPTLTTVLSRTLYSELDEWAKTLKDRLHGCNEDDKQSEHYSNLLKKSLEGRKSCLQAGFIKSVAEFSQGLYAEQTAIRLELIGKGSVKELMDSNPMIFAFKDSVYDFKLVDGKPIGRRPIEATDYITITCGYNYPVRNPAIRQQMEAVLKGIWSKQGEYGDDGQTYDYVMNIMASTLCGTRWMEAFYILTGSGRNGKGLLFELLQAVMGDYYYQLPVQVLTTKIDNPRAPNPDIANLVGKRMACSSEPEANEKLHEGTIKYMTGGDKLTGRALYGSPIQFKPQFGLFLQCNNIPNFNGITRGGVMRNRVIPFPFEFKSDPKTSREKPSDPHIKDVLCKSAEWRDEMFLLLLDRFEAIRGKGIDGVKMSALVEERTNEYVAENNLIGCWWIENYEACEGSYVLSKEAFMEFKAETQSAMSDKQFKAGLAFNLVEIKKIGKCGVMKDKMGIANWKRREHDNQPGSDDEKENQPMFSMFRK